MSPYNLIAFEQNGAPIHPMNGNPLRLVIPGWPGSCSHKWLTRIEIRDQVHDGAKMTGKSYRVPRYPVAPGQEVPEEDFVIIESLPVKSLITYPETGTEISASHPAALIRGHAWAGDNKVAKVDISIDFGSTWTSATLTEPVNDYAWQHWRAGVRFPDHRLLRGLGARDRRARAGRHPSTGLESEGLSQQLDAPDCGPVGLSIVSGPIDRTGEQGACCLVSWAAGWRPQPCSDSVPYPRAPGPRQNWIRLHRVWPKLMHLGEQDLPAMQGMPCR